MKFNHKVVSEYKPTFRTSKVTGMFDVPVTDKIVKEWEVDFPIEQLDDEQGWNIGLIVGPSGAGKTTLAKHIFGEEAYHEGFDWPFDQSILDGFKKGLSANDITSALSHVGFSSPPSWLIPFNKLSNGQRFRAEMARLILESEGDEPIVVDEFTSVVDRTVAQTSSHAVQKYVRKQNKKMVAVSCHYDIIEWLQPDWIYYVDSNEFKVTRGSLRRPDINLHIERVHHSAWRLFKGHHYLTHDINTSSHCYLASIDGTPVGFCAVLAFPHPHVKNMWKSHRTVILPDFQGIGIGGILNETVAQHYLDQGMRFTGVSSHPAMNAYRNKSPKWVLTRAPSMVPAVGKNGMQSIKDSASLGRMTASFEYVGDRESKEK